MAAYIFNISKNKEHVFATAEHSCPTRYHAVRLYNLLIAKFPECEGYTVMCEKLEKAYYDVTQEIMLAKPANTKQ